MLSGPLQVLVEVFLVSVQNCDEIKNSTGLVVTCDLQKNPTVG